MRIAEIVPSLEEQHGGPSKSVLRLSTVLAESGHDVTVLATEPGAGSVRTEGRLSVEQFHRDWPRRLCRSRVLRLRLGQIAPEIVHHHSLWLRTLHYARAAAAGAGAPLVVSPRGMMAGWAWAQSQWPKRLATLLVHPGALAAVRGWHATSEKEADDIRRRGFSQPICVAPNGVDCPTAQDQRSAAESWRVWYPEIARQPVALFYSRFHRKKRVLELIDLWLERGPRDWLLLIAGIPQEYTEAMLTDYVFRASGGGRIVVADGVGRPPPYAAASLFLLPSHDENFGMVVAEALAAGLPAIVTDTTPWSGLNGRGSWCVPWSGFAQALREAAAEGPERLRARGAQGRAWVERDYSWDKPARKLADFYASLRGA